MRSGLFLCFLFFWSMAAYCQSDTTQQVIPGRKNSAAQQKKPYVILISADGFRDDYAQKYQASNLRRLAASGIKADYMLPSYPSLTFPNHYTLVTGLTPAHHGLVGNNFYDPLRKETYFKSNRKNTIDSTWYGGTPLWVLAERQQMLSATFYWVGSDAGVKNTFPTYYYHYNERIDINRRINAVVRWLSLPAEERPHFITFYLPQVDEAGHWYGPDAPETGRSVRFVDSVVNELNKVVKATGLDVSYVFVSDHGMAKTDNKDPISIPAVVDTAKYLAYGDVTLVNLYAKKGADIAADHKRLKAKAKGYDVYLKSSTPARLRFGEADDRYNRIGDIVLAAQVPNVFQFGSYNINVGQHGYDVKLVPEMRAVFYAWGPAFKKGINIKPFKNVSIYNLIANILGLTITEKVDGDDRLAKEILLKK
ncbi:alkaline phosphatase family protein [Mucilaginibacter hurinus]|uniref:Alkaline phosphatase family protein n=1 Tax=Mucilaginibacter hurinus TaxID=2201324 RepID=A0A367GKT0_9SPHI|nr:ectonucleotide pyrophosphatase/phosphodiesterase [Mucilaginibacter hurinus]RCH54094.1 alkaline phosphatase family protein [Mucilaginibacter hurinus]